MALEVLRIQGPSQGSKYTWLYAPFSGDSSRWLHTHGRAWVSQVPRMGMIDGWSCSDPFKLVAVAALGHLRP